MKPTGGAALLAALACAILVVPFAGGVRGVAPYAVWVLLPLWAVGFDLPRARRELGLDPPAPRALLLAAGLGAACAAALLALDGAFPRTLEFVRLLPYLHRDFVRGNTWLFIALIPAAHVAHELFYRGLLQERLATRLGASAGVLVAALLFAWTHVFVFTSAEYLEALARLRGTGFDPAAPARTLGAVLGFCALESLLGGALLRATRSLWSAVVFRAVNLVLIALALRAAGQLGS